MLPSQEGADITITSTSSHFLVLGLYYFRITGPSVYLKYNNLQENYQEISNPMIAPEKHLGTNSADWIIWGGEGKTFTSRKKKQCALDIYSPKTFN